MAVALGKSLSQKDPALHPGVKDIDDCWVVAGIQSARAVGGNITGIDIPKYRKAAGRPDTPGTDGGSAADVLRGAQRLWPKLRLRLSPHGWDAFKKTVLREGYVTVVLVNSGKLPLEHQYGFKGLHAITLRVVSSATATVWYIINPLQPKGTPAKRITEAQFKAAAMSFPAPIQGVFFQTVAAPVAPPVTPPPTTPPTPTPTPPIVDDTPFSQADLDDAYEKGHVDGLQDAIDAIEALV